MKQLTAFLVSVFLVGGFFHGSAVAGGKPNIIFIMADDLGYGDLGCYGQKKIKTPFLDALARQGMRFTQVYAGSTVCAPSRCSLMTGLHTGHCLVRGNARVPLRPQDVTVAEVLKQVGYTTALIGKWGLGEADSTGIPTRQGFDYFFGYLNQHHAHNYYPGFLWRNEKKVKLKNEVVPGGWATKKVEYSHDLVTEEALSFIKKNKAGPFFLYLAYTIPHANNELGRHTRGKGKENGMEIPSDAPYSKMLWPQAQKDHAAMITHLDRDIGRLMALLEKLDLEDNTIVFFTSDNGPHQEGGARPAFFNSSGGLRGFKRSLHEGGIRVPMIVRWKGKIRAGTTNDHIWAFWDVLPTCADLAGAKTPAKLDGLSVLATLLGKNKQQRQHDSMYWEFHERRTYTDAKGKKRTSWFSEGIRMGDWKAVRYGQDKLELYNLKSDRAEKNDIALQHPAIVARLEQLLRGARTPSQHWPIRKGSKKKQK